jgi:hypothetical protein
MTECHCSGHFVRSRIDTMRRTPLKAAKTAATRLTPVARSGIHDSTRNASTGKGPDSFMGMAIVAGASEHYLYLGWGRECHSPQGGGSVDWDEFLYAVFSRRCDSEVAHRRHHGR